MCDVCACVGADLVLVRIAIVDREPIARWWSVAAWVGPWLARVVLASAPRLMRVCMDAGEQL